jgi:hypothetical protein
MIEITKKFKWGIPKISAFRSTDKERFESDTSHEEKGIFFVKDKDTPKAIHRDFSRSAI